MTAGEWIDLILARAAALREAGVQHIAIGGASAQLAPPAPTMVQLDNEPAAAPIILDALNDPATFGGVLPGYVIPTYEHDDEAIP